MSKPYTVTEGTSKSRSYLDLDGPRICTDPFLPLRLWNLQQVKDVVDLLRLAMSLPKSFVAGQKRILGVRFRGDFGLELSSCSDHLRLYACTFSFKKDGVKKFMAGQAYRYYGYPGKWSSLEMLPGDVLPVTMLSRQLRTMITDRFDALRSRLGEEAGSEEDFEAALFSGRILHEGRLPWISDRIVPARARVYPRSLPETVAEAVEEDERTAEQVAEELGISVDTAKSCANLDGRYMPELLERRILLERRSGDRKVVRYLMHRIHKDIFAADPHLTRFLLDEEPNLVMALERVLKFRNVLFSGDVLALQRWRSLNLAEAELAALEFWIEHKPTLISSWGVASVSLRLFDLRRSITQDGEDDYLRRVESAVERCKRVSSYLLKAGGKVA